MGLGCVFGLGLVLWICVFSDLTTIWVLELCFVVAGNDGPGFVFLRFLLLPGVLLWCFLDFDRFLGFGLLSLPGLDFGCFGVLGLCAFWVPLSGFLGF